MPRAGTVGGGHDDGNASHDKCDKCAGHAEVGCRLETEECEIIMQEIAAPDGHGEEDEQRNVLDLAKRHHALPYSADGVFHLIIYSELAYKHP